ncbi:MAG: UvrD-helicase domain-containing protein [Clostridiales bacterium]|nr:UvrD-helicase domain-containing protein [Clostridiales bacterium]
MDQQTLQQETEWLNAVLAEARRQYQDAGERDDALESDALETQRELWENVGSFSADNGLDQLVDFLEYISVMKKQKRSHGIIEAQKAKYAKMLLSPYFGRIDFRAAAAPAAKAYYIGTFSLICDDNELLVYDWRAPVSGMFYDDEVGPARFETPGGAVSGELLLKRQYKIENGTLEYCFDSGLKIDDEILQQMLAQHADGRMRTIVTTIQREQNRAIRNESYRHLIVQGAAGSGKTSVALHRIAYLLYRRRDTISAKNIIVFSPNSVFSDYISNVLPELGESNMLQTTFDAFLSGALKAPGRRERYYERMEYLLASRDNPAYPSRIASMRLKSSAAFRDALTAYAGRVESEAVRFPDLSCQGARIASSAELERLFSYDYADLPYFPRLEKLRERMQYLLNAHEARRADEIAATLSAEEGYIDRAELRRRSRAAAKQETREARAEAARMTGIDVTSVYESFLAELPELLPAEPAEQTEDISRYTLETIRTGQLHYEDQIALLYLQGRLGGTQKTAQIRFVIVDEAQDYTPLQYEIIRLFFAQASVTMLGDLDQSISPYASLGSYESLSQLFPPEDTLTLRFTKSYRSTAEITAFCGSILGRAGAVESVGRHGSKPAVAAVPNAKAAFAAIRKDIQDFTAQGYASIGIITRTRAEAEQAYHALGTDVSLHAVLGGEDEFPRGAVVLPAYLAKGLEFDAVILTNAGGGNYAEQDERLLLYTACTRALHELRVYHIGPASPFLPQLQSG